MKKLDLSKLAMLVIVLLGLNTNVLAQITGITTLCSGSSTVLSGSPSGGTWSTSSTAMAVFTTPPGTVYGYGSGTATVTYTVGGTPTTAVLTILPAPTPYTVTPLSGGSYCLGGSGVEIKTTGSNIGISYQLKQGSTPIGSPVAGTGSPISFGYQTTTGAYTVEGIDASTGCVGNMSTGTSITTNPLPVAYSVVGGGSLCAGGAGVSVLLAGSVFGVNYQMYNGSTPVGAAIPGTGGALSFGPYTTAGTYTIIATNGLGCTNTMFGSAVITVNALPARHVVTGGGAYCTGGAGAAVGISNSSTGVNYQLYLSGIAIGSAIPGTGSALSFGLQTATGSYYAMGTNATTACTDTMAGSATVSTTSPVTPSVSLASSPGDTVCPGTSVTFTATPVNGGTTPTYAWTVNGLAVATSTVTYGYTPANGDVVAVTMTSSALCVTTTTVTATRNMVVNYITPISGTTTVCTGATTALIHATTGGAWSSSDITVATVSSSGVVTGVTGGTAIITYLLPTGCYATAVVTVNALPTITASSSASSCGPNHTLTAAGATTYSWTPTTGLSCPTCAITTVNPAATTTYTVAGTNASGCTNTNTVTVTADRIYGHITFSAAIPDTLDMKVWLIQFNPSDSSITALDSTNTCPIDSVGYYEFNGKPAGSYLVKAKMVYSKPVGTSGYLPTYGLSTPNWYASASATHTTASTDTLHITMAYGTVPAGPGFIGGYVYAGAGKGTSGETGVPDMTIYLKNAAGNVIAFAYTDGSGAYSFPSIAYGDYYISPEEFDFNTITSDKITLTAENPSAAAVSFKQYATSRVIKPYTEATSVKPVVSTQAISVYPNPSNGALNIQWTNQKAGNAKVTITDVMGREVFTSAFSIGTVNGTAAFDLNKLTNGLYMISIGSANISYNSKLLIQK